MDHQNDSFGLFADVLAGTLGIVALIALLMVLAAGDWHVTPEVAHRDELRSAALPIQVAVAKKRVAQSGERLEKESARAAAGLGVPPPAVIAWVQQEATDRALRNSAATRGEGAAAAALSLRKENLRLGQKVADLRVLKDALDTMVADLRERPHPVSPEGLVEPVTPLRVLREGREAPKPFYLICRAGRIYAAYLFADDMLQPNRQDLSWITFPGEKLFRSLPMEGRGWDLAEAGRRVPDLGAQLRQHPDYYAVVLAFPDSFAEARELLRLLDAANVAFTWRPYPAGEAVDFAVDGVNPPPPL